MDDEEHSCVCKCTDAFVSLPIFLLKKSEPFLEQEQCLELIASLQRSELLFFPKNLTLRWLCKDNVYPGTNLPKKYRANTWPSRRIFGAKYVLDRVSPSKVFNFIRDFLLGHSLGLRSIKSDLTNHYYRLDLIFIDMPFLFWMKNIYFHFLI